jgi:hypothetical protein
MVRCPRDRQQPEEDPRECNRLWQQISHPRPFHITFPVVPTSRPTKTSTTSGQVVLSNDSVSDMIHFKHQNLPYSRCRIINSFQIDTARLFRE